MKLSYWFAECLDDHNAYSIRTKTKREAVKLVALDPSSFGPVRKVSIEVDSMFELMKECLSEDSRWWEDEA